MTGTTIAQMVPLLLLPVLTRLFSPEEFGLLAVYSSIIMFVAVIGAGRYEQAILLPKEDEKAVNILVLCFLILTGLLVIILLVLSVLDDWLIAQINRPALEPWLWFIPIGVFFASAYRILTAWSNRKKRFKGTSLAIGSQTLSRSGIQLIGGIQKQGTVTGKMSFSEFVKALFNKKLPEPTGVSTYGLGALILSFIGGFFIGTLILLIPFWRRDRPLLSAVSWLEMKRQAKVYDKFPKINSVHAMSDELKNVGVTTTITYFFSEAILGFYSMCMRVLRAPLTVIGNSFAQVFYQKAAELYANEKSFMSLFRSTTKKLMIIAAPIFIVIAFFGPDLFEFVLGGKWREAGVYSQYLTPWLFGHFIIYTIQQVAVILEKQLKLFFFSLAYNAIMLGSLIIGHYVFDDIVAGFILLSSLMSVYFVLLYLWLVRISKQSCDKFLS